MAGAKEIKALLKKRKMTVKALAETLEIEPQSMSNKLFRDSFTFAEVVKIADLLNADVKIILRDSDETV